MKREEGSNYYKPNNSFKNKCPNILHNIEYIDIDNIRINHNSAGVLNNNLRLENSNNPINVNLIYISLMRYQMVTANRSQSK